MGSREATILKVRSAIISFLLSRSDSLGHFDTDFDALFHGAEGAKTCIRCAKKQTVAKRLFAGAKRLLRAEGACCWRRRRLVQGKKHSREATIAGAKRLLRAEGACCWRRRRLL